MSSDRNRRGAEQPVPPTAPRPACGGRDATEPDRQPKTTIRQLRQARGWSQLDLALRLQVSPGAISFWERGTRRPQPRHQQGLASLFGVPVEAIAFGLASQERP